MSHGGAAIHYTGKVKHLPCTAHADRNRLHSALVWSAALIWSGCIGACGSPYPSGVGPHRDRAALITGAPARSVPIVIGADGRPATWDDLISAAASADVVILGENHGHPLGLSVAAALWEDILSRSDRAALAMEFIERDEQAPLDDYLTGIVDEAAFVKATRRTDSNYPPGHRAMVEAAKARNRPVIAANAPRIYVRLARTDGYEKLATLTSEQKRLFVVPRADQLPQPGSKYRDDFNTVMGLDPAGTTPPDPERIATVEAMFRSQSVWDWTMAESVAQAAAAGSSPVVLVVGRFHSDFDGGLVQALRAMRPGVRIVTVSFADAAPPEGNAMREEDRGRAEFVVYVGEGGAGRSGGG